MKDMTFVEWVLLFALALILIAVFLGASNTRGEFKRICDEARGTTVWDGRQYQCVKP